MAYTYPLSYGNPMFPEAFWGHDVHNGGYCHVDFTMPPTANVSILHTLSPPTVSSPGYKRFLHWARKANLVPAGKPLLEHHELLCRPVIRGRDATLYFSHIEALPYLAELSAGQPRDSLRIYWGCMRWPVQQLSQEIADGHFIPIQISPKFFQAFPALKQNEKDGEGKARKSPSRFATNEEIAQRKKERKRVLGVDVVSPQTFPPDQPMCRREALWDQIMLALGGEFKHLVGSHNPFVPPGSDARLQLPTGAGLLDDSGGDIGQED